VADRGRFGVEGRKGIRTKGQRIENRNGLCIVDVERQYYSGNVYQRTKN